MKALVTLVVIPVTGMSLNFSENGEFHKVKCIILIIYWVGESINCVNIVLK